MWRQLKRRLRQKRRWLSLGVWVLLLGAVAATYGLAGREKPGEQSAIAPIRTLEVEGGDAVPVQRSLAPEETAAPGEHQEAILQRIRAHSGKREVLLQSNYVCGEEVEKLGRKSALEILEIHRDNPTWAVTIDRDGAVYFVRKVEDLSPSCRENAYFGIDRNGNLSLFDGLPQSDKVLRTFFQLNIEYLESSLPKETLRQLQEGIRITDLAEYNSVLSTFSDFALEPTERVMKPEP